MDGCHAYKYLFVNFKSIFHPINISNETSSILIRICLLKRIGENKVINDQAKRLYFDKYIEKYILGRKIVADVDSYFDEIIRETTDKTSKYRYWSIRRCG